MSKAVAAVQKLYHECGLTEPLELPIETIIKSKNILIKEEEIDGADGRILMKENSGIITVNSNISFYPRKRFILAHELGHYDLQTMTKR
jgi:Zn-dependent peptidase ImmA (M78 family)